MYAIRSYYAYTEPPEIPQLYEQITTTEGGETTYNQVDIYNNGAVAGETYYTQSIDAGSGESIYTEADIATDGIDENTDYFTQTTTAGHGGNGNRNCSLMEDDSLSTPAYPYVEGQGPSYNFV